MSVEEKAFVYKKKKKNWKKISIKINLFGSKAIHIGHYPPLLIMHTVC
jgi:hypothetical protein